MLVGVTNNLPQFTDEINEYLPKRTERKHLRSNGATNNISIKEPVLLTNCPKDTLYTWRNKALKDGTSSH